MTVNTVGTGNSSSKTVEKYAFQGKCFRTRNTNFDEENSLGSKTQNAHTPQRKVKRRERDPRSRCPWLQNCTASGKKIFTIVICQITTG